METALTHPRNSLKNKLPFLIKMLISLSLLGWVFHKLNWENLLSQLLQTSILYIVLAVGLIFLSQVLSALRWYYLSQPFQFPHRLASFLRLYFIGVFFNAFLPTLVGGDVVKGYYLTRGKGSLSQAALSVLIDRNAGLGGLILLGCFSLLWISLPLPREVSLSIGALMLAYFFVNLILFLSPFIQITSKIIKKMPLALLRKNLLNFFNTAFILPALKYRFIFAIIVSLAIQCIGILAIYCIGSSLSITLNFVAYLRVIPLIAIISMIPISIGGLGVRETAFLTLFTQLGLPGEKAVALSLLWYVCMLFGGIPGFLLYLFQSSKYKK